MQDTLDRLLSDPAAVPDPEWVRQVMAAHPTFAVAGALLLRHHGATGSHEPSAHPGSSVLREPLPATARMGSSALREPLPATADSKLAARVMLATPDPTAMADLADLAESDWAHFYPHAEAPATKTTVDTIDTFLSTYGSQSPEEDALLERMIFNPVAPDYFSGTDEPFDPSNPLALPPELAENAPAAKNTHEAPATPSSPAVPDAAAPSALASPLFSQTALPEDQPVETHDEPLLMESLAKIFIKQHRYERAFEIINNISLKNPEKSAYFADQLRFLQKLINNQRFLDAQKGQKSQ